MPLCCLPLLSFDLRTSTKIFNLFSSSAVILCVFYFSPKAFSTRRFLPHRPTHIDLCLAGIVMDSDKSAGQRCIFISYAWNSSQLWICIPAPEYSRANIIVRQMLNEAFEYNVKIVFDNDTCLSQQPFALQMMKCFSQYTLCCNKVLKQKTHDSL